MKIELLSNLSKMIMVLLILGACRKPIPLLKGKYFPNQRHCGEYIDIVNDSTYIHGIPQVEYYESGELYHHDGRVTLDGFKKVCGEFGIDTSVARSTIQFDYDEGLLKLGDIRWTHFTK